VRRREGGWTEHEADDEETRMTLDIWAFRIGVRRTDADLQGLAVNAADGSIGKVQEVVERESRTFLLVDTGPWVFGKTIKVPAGLVSSIDLDEGIVAVDRSKDEIKEAPDHGDFIDESSHDDALARHYGGFEERTDPAVPAAPAPLSGVTALGGASTAPLAGQQPVAPVGAGPDAPRPASEHDDGESQTAEPPIERDRGEGELGGAGVTPGRAPAEPASAIAGDAAPPPGPDHREASGGPGRVDVPAGPGEGAERADMSDAGAASPAADAEEAKPSAETAMPMPAGETNTMPLPTDAIGEVPSDGDRASRPTPGEDNEPPEQKSGQRPASGLTEQADERASDAGPASKPASDAAPRPSRPRPSSRPDQAKERPSPAPARRRTQTPGPAKTSKATRRDGDRSKAEEPAREPAQPKRQRGTSTQKDVPLARYDSLTAAEVMSRLRGLTQRELATVERYERANEGRATILRRVSSLREKEPWRGYDAATVKEVTAKLAKAKPDRVATVRDYERRHRNRTGVMDAVRRLLKN
jgi:hypothetical protein